MVNGGAAVAGRPERGTPPSRAREQKGRRQMSARWRGMTAPPYEGREAGSNPRSLYPIVAGPLRSRVPMMYTDDVDVGFQPTLRFRQTCPDILFLRDRSRATSPHLRCYPCERGAACSLGHH